MSSRKVIATISSAQVDLIAELFASFGQTYYIKPVDERTPFVYVYLYGCREANSHHYVSTGWDKSAETESVYFDEFYSACKKELEKIEVK